jgi:putative tryptophan/tyrosine transport system substrate-binding protein
LSPYFSNSHHQIVAPDNQSRIPTIYPLPQYVVSGRLFNYGTGIIDAYRQSGVYTALTLKGAKPSELPVQQPTKFDLVVNPKVATALDLIVPQTLLVTRQ